MNPILMVLVAVAGLLASLLFDGLKHLLPILDEQSDPVKKIVAALVAAFVGWLAAHFGAVLPPDVHGWTPEALVAVVTVLLQAGYYRLTKRVGGGA